MILKYKNNQGKNEKQVCYFSIWEIVGFIQRFNFKLL